MPSWLGGRRRVSPPHARCSRPTPPLPPMPKIVCRNRSRTPARHSSLGIFERPVGRPGATSETNQPLGRLALGVLEGLCCRGDRWSVEALARLTRNGGTCRRTCEMLAGRLARSVLDEPVNSGEVAGSSSAPYGAELHPPRPGVYRGALVSPHLDRRALRQGICPGHAENRAAARIPSRLPPLRESPQKRAEASIRRGGRHRPGRWSRLGLCLDRGMVLPAPRTHKLGEQRSCSPGHVPNGHLNAAIVPS